MSSGGNRGGAGRPASTSSFRYDASEWTVLALPSARSRAKPPEFPLPNPSEREQMLWESHWKKPQATQWKVQDLTDEVALYVRYLAEAECPEAATSIRQLVRQHRDLLGLSTSGMSRMKWRIEEPPKKEPRVKREASPSPPAHSSKDRYKQVNGDAR